MTITDISTQMRRLADMAGGDHLTGKEIEKQLNQLARELDANVFMTVDIVDHLRSITLDACGLTEESLRLYRKHNSGKEGDSK